jgi:hypothetical protein
MKPSRISEVLDLALIARKSGYRFAPMLRGGAGLGKSEIVQQWVAQQRVKNPNFGFLDLRLAYYEAPDVIGFPVSFQDVTGKLRTTHALPDFWPTEGEGLILLEEVNRGTQGVMNTMMQLLTDRQVGPHYKLPEGWMIASCVNPDDANYDVNSMDTALLDRFEIFDIDFDHMTFIEFIESKKWHHCITRYVKSGAWTFKAADSIGKEGKYISPRTWSKLNAAEQAGAQDNRQLHRIICQSVLGKHVGNEYWKSCWDDAPVTAQDLLSNKSAAIKKLKEQSKPESYQGDRIAVTVESMVQAYGGLDKAGGGTCSEDQVSEALMAEVAAIIPSDQAVNLIKECGYKAYKGQITNFFKEFTTRHPECVDVLRDNIRINRAVDKAEPKKK